MDDKAAAILKKRTLTNLYNERAAWLTNAHRDLDAAVAAAYEWPSDISEEVAHCLDLAEQTSDFEHSREPCWYGDEMVLDWPMMSSHRTNRMPGTDLLSPRDPSIQTKIGSMSRPRS